MTSNFQTSLQKINRLQSFIALFLLCTLLTILTDKFFTPENGLNVLRQVAVNICISVGMTLIVLTAGIDLSVGSVLALCSALAVGLFKEGVQIPSLNLFIGFTVLGALVAAVVIGLLLGYFNGWVITRFHIPPFVATLAMLTIARGLTMLYTQGHPISNLGSSFAFLGTGWILGIPVPVYIATAVVVAAIFITKKTKLGRYIYAIGGNEQAAKLSGIPINQVKIKVYAIAGALAALGGIIVASRLDSAQPNAGLSYELDAIAAVVIGGTSLSG
ncbi:MAG: hypothetical protein RL034_915, partial [Bacteroidota bacterium]